MKRVVLAMMLVLVALTSGGGVIRRYAMYPVVVLPVGGDVETACATAGANCIFSETLDTPTFTTVGGSACGDDVSADFDNSTTKESSTGWVNCVDISMVPEVNMPAGNTVSYVMRSDHVKVQAHHMEMSAGAIPSGKKRMCVRAYRMHSADYISTGADKKMEFFSSANTAIQMTTGTWPYILDPVGGVTYQPVQGVDYPYCTSSNVPWNCCYDGATYECPGYSPGAGNRINPETEDNLWLREEMCISSDTDIKTGNIWVEGYAEEVEGTGKRVDFYRVPVGTWDSGNIGNTLVAMGYRENLGTDTGYFLLSHAMVQVWDTDEGQFIGAACEVEGGCPAQAWASTWGACTKGTNCYCDRARGNGPLGTTDPVYNANIEFCEDFDHNALYLTTPTHPGGFGNWASGTGGDRGVSGYWIKKMGGTMYGSVWENNQPPLPVTYGSQCTAGPCSGHYEWDATDRWQANQYDPWIDIIVSDSDYSSEYSQTPRTIPSRTESVFGNAAMALRNPRNVGGGGRHTGGYVTDYAVATQNTEFNTGRVRSQLGMTAAIAFDSNIIASQILDDNLKHEEWNGARSNTLGDDGLTGFRSTNWNEVLGHGVSRSTYPFHGTFFTLPPWSCDTMKANAQNVVGEVLCNGPPSTGATIHPYLSGYNFTNDWQLGQWNCVSWHWDFRNIASVNVKAWHNGTLVIDVRNLNFTGSLYDATTGTDGWRLFNFGNYSNKSYYTPPLAAPTRRYYDNYTVRDGPPVLCEDLGFPASYNQSGL